MPGVPVKEFKRAIQLDGWSCGAVSAYMIALHYGKNVTYAQVVKAVKSNEEQGTLVKPLIRGLRKFGLTVRYLPKMNIRQLKDALSTNKIVLVHLDGNHYGVVHGFDDKGFFIADPSVRRCPMRTITREEYAKRWTNWGLVVSSSTPAKTPGLFARFLGLFK